MWVLNILRSYFNVFRHRSRNWNLMQHRDWPLCSNVIEEGTYAVNLNEVRVDRGERRLFRAYRSRPKGAKVVKCKNWRAQNFSEIVYCSIILNSLEDPSNYSFYDCIHDELMESWRFTRQIYFIMLWCIVVCSVTLELQARTKDVQVSVVLEIVYFQQASRIDSFSNFSPFLIAKKEQLQFFDSFKLFGVIGNSIATILPQGIILFLINVPELQIRISFFHKRRNAVHEYRTGQ